MPEDAYRAKTIQTPQTNKVRIRYCSAANQGHDRSITHMISSSNKFDFKTLLIILFCTSQTLIPSYLHLDLLRTQASCWPWSACAERNRCCTLPGSSKKTAILLHVVTSHLIPPAPPWSMLLPNACRHPNRNSCFFEGLSKQSDVTTLNWGKGAMQVSSQWVWQDGCFFWRTP